MAKPKKRMTIDGKTYTHVARHTAMHLLEANKKNYRAAGYSVRVIGSGFYRDLYVRKK